MLYIDGLDQLVQQLESTLGIPTTRDPSVVLPLVSSTSNGAIFVGFPTHVKRLLSGASLEVPISLVAPAPGDLTSVNWLLTHYDKFVETVGAKSVTITPFSIGDATLPSVNAVAQLVVESE